jgi:hypothetical protein
MEFAKCEERTQASIEASDLRDDNHERKKVKKVRNRRYLGERRGALAYICNLAAWNSLKSVKLGVLR